mmetsp:Transcript_123935/g.246734  ORF Transcript_123935/g.246734 Transcript_123935/m.246734 type:complete len:273 (-) Transcript_123935:483-1301(-)|eukprot:CAMPEP_0172921746 /NCGR_PEP_ID=MMETSP1075-20121228/206526_1 /TAXON_ID=2916 /ORGANISM="Ceratium fusus, Strain PA161109" /LENGTH=272 /DNA_ID=CAMNT_0013781957 /DNA_START=42 /DNA_END=860 /DNA_ORIENTATION=-
MAFWAIRCQLPLRAAHLCGQVRALGRSATLANVSRTYYDILDVPRRAKQDEIKDAYRKLAKRYHPDRNVDDPEAENKFKEIQEAHATLSDSWKRALYDQDLQFGQYGSASATSVDKEKWTEHWAKETPEEREARKERYRRYAAGERNDLPPDPFPLKLTPFIYIGAYAGFFFICARAPDWIDLQSDPTFNDPAYDDRTVPLVRAFHDPVQNRWERLPEGVEPPKPADLYAYYQKRRPELMDACDLRLLPKVSLTTLLVPKTDVVKTNVHFHY